MKFCAVVFLVYLAIATDAIKRKKVCKQILGKLSDLEVLIKKKQGCCTVGKVFVPLQSRIVRMTLETQVWIKCFSLNFLGNWTTPLRLVLPEKNINNAKTYFRHRANGFEGRIHLTRYASNFAQRTSYFFLVLVNTSRNTVNTYFSVTFGLQLLLDEKHVYGARQRFFEGESSEVQILINGPFQSISPAN